MKKGKERPVRARKEGKTMKKVLAVLLLLSLLTGCSFRENPEQTGMQTEETEAQTAAAAESSLSEAPATSLPEESAPRKNFTENGTVIGEGGLYELDSVKLPGTCAEIYRFRDSLLIVCTETDEDGTGKTVLELLDPVTGEVQRKQTLDRIGTGPLQLSNRYIFCHDWASGRTEVLDAELNRVKTVEIGGNWEPVYFSADGTLAYLFPGKGGMELCRPDTGKTEKAAEDLLSIRNSRLCGDQLILEYTDARFQKNRTGRLDLATGRLTEMPFRQGRKTASFLRGDWLAWDGNENCWLYGKNGNPAVLSVGEASLELTEGPLPLLSREDDGKGMLTLRLYGEDGHLGAACRIDRGEESSLSDPVWSPEQQGYFMIRYFYDRGSRLVFWKPEEPEEPDWLPSVSLAELSEPVPGTELPEELYERAVRLGKTYGIRIRIAEQCRTEYPFYDMEPETDPDRVSLALDTLETALHAYPRGFAGQLACGDMEEVEINLTGKLTCTESLPEDTNGFTEFAAFVVPLEDRLVMAADINTAGLEQSFYHEFSHMIDRKLQNYSELCGSLYSEEGWAALNPPSFRYAEDLQRLPDSIYGEDYEKYFIDTYARTFPTEDRARVMEYAMAGEDGYFAADYYGPLREKLAYYSACIRECFDTRGWPETVRWEEPLKGYRYKSTGQSGAAG